MTVVNTFVLVGRRIAVLEHGKIELSTDIFEALDKGAEKHLAKERERTQLEMQRAAQPAKKKLSKEERLAQEVLRMYKSWDSMRGIEITHEGFFPPELEYIKCKQKRPEAESRIKDKCRWPPGLLDQLELNHVAFSGA